MDQLPRLWKRELIGLLLLTCNYVVYVLRGFLFLWVLGIGYVILLWHSLSIPYNYFLFGGGGFPLPLGTWDGLRYFMVALPWPSIQLFHVAFCILMLVIYMSAVTN